jgi:predicted GIY-YIG superfamily endonuclease
LLHFDTPYRHARHYLGYAADLDVRLAQHRAGRGARLVEVITEAGISFTLARTWEGDRTMERRLKNRHASPRLCPLCRARESR